MKKVKVLLMAILIVAASSCSKSKNNNKLVGEWKTNRVISGYEELIIETYTFTDDGYFSIRSDEFMDEGGTWIHKGDEIYLYYGFKKQTDAYILHIKELTDTQLVFSSGSSTDTRVYLKKSWLNIIGL